MDKPPFVFYDKIAKCLEVSFGLFMLFFRVRSFLTRAVREVDYSGNGLHPRVSVGLGGRPMKESFVYEFLANSSSVLEKRRLFQVNF